jgi:hypothetical protein
MKFISKRNWYDLDDWQTDNPIAYERIMDGFSILNGQSPLTVDVNIKEVNELTHEYFIDFWPKGTVAGFTPAITNPQTRALEKFYRDVFCDVVTETRFAQPTGNYSEKAYQPMYYMKPFVLCAPPGTLRWLRSEGFMTFGDFWDETYDYCEDHEVRLFKIFEILEYINSKTLDELREIYMRMIPILEHNKKLLATKVI